MSTAVTIQVRFRYWRLWPLPIWVASLRVGSGRREWILIGPWSRGGSWTGGHV